MFNLKKSIMKKTKTMIGVITSIALGITLSFIPEQDSAEAYMAETHTLTTESLPMGHYSVECSGSGSDCEDEGKWLIRPAR